jgi:hypothetical protein
VEDTRTTHQPCLSTPGSRRAPIRAAGLLPFRAAPGPASPVTFGTVLTRLNGVTGGPCHHSSCSALELLARLRWRWVKALCLNGRVPACVQACRTCRVVELGKRRFPRAGVAGALTAWPLVGRCFAQPVGSASRADGLTPIETWADLAGTRLLGQGSGPGSQRQSSASAPEPNYQMPDLAVARDLGAAHVIMRVYSSREVRSAGNP